MAIYDTDKEMRETALKSTYYYFKERGRLSTIVDYYKRNTQFLTIY